MRNEFMGKAICCGGATTILLILCSLRSVPPAHTGVVTTFGSVSTSTLEAGLHILNPVSNVVLFSKKTILLEQQNHVPTKEGLTVDLDVAVLFHIIPEKARDIYLSLGEDYEHIVVQPELSSAVRGLTSESEAKALYTEGRSEMQHRLKDELSRALTPRGIVVEDVLLKAVKLPAQLTHSIELKAQAEQESARMEFVLTKEKQEADRKGIEAKGIADFQRIVSEGISEQLLSWKGIEATERLAQSNNAKMVIVGNSKDSLPVLLSADAQPANPPSQYPPSPQKAQQSLQEAFSPLR
eukprot:CAMPEP_0181315086 /NCGR_PEP_ID=MMETSP1101-20121128/15176_1 /TAXON_ID=46948 /ORGANISM="Rhodomonas abbreviata, Strain Caron Lab Isolate" /LENGTH=295 /DNA_ID=CAMNT_0023422247 /DNA_START=171 /DNA_END=1058 /DNA_ORIENTATION=-